jgi:hypothetical protein
MYYSHYNTYITHITTHILLTLQHIYYSHYNTYITHITTHVITRIYCTLQHIYYSHYNTYITHITTHILLTLQRMLLHAFTAHMRKYYYIYICSKTYIPALLKKKNCIYTCVVKRADPAESYTLLPLIRFVSY